MITMQEEKGIPDLKGPQVQHTLKFLFSALIPMKEINIEADLNTKISPVTCQHNHPRKDIEFLLDSLQL